MANITQLRSQLNTLLARREQLKDRMYYTAAEEEARLPKLKSKINEVEIEINKLINNIEVNDFQNLTNQNNVNNSETIG